MLHANMLAVVKTKHEQTLERRALKMDKDTLRSRTILFGGIFVGWLACMTVLVQYIFGL